MIMHGDAYRVPVVCTGCWHDMRMVNHVPQNYIAHSGSAFRLLALQPGVRDGRGISNRLANAQETAADRYHPPGVCGTTTGEHGFAVGRNRLPSIGLGSDAVRPRIEKLHTSPSEATPLTSTESIRQ